MSCPSVPWLKLARSVLNLSDLDLWVKPEWGSDFSGLPTDEKNIGNSNFRDRIRHGIIERLRIDFPVEMNHEDLDQILNLDIIPRFRLAQFSISHCRGLGGFSYSKQASCLGLDIEVLERIKVKIVQRVSDQAELNANPFPEALWVAKEASFKALDSDRWIPMSEIKISDWQNYQNSWSYLASYKNEQAQGFLTSDGKWLYSLATKKSN